MFSGAGVLVAKQKKPKKKTISTKLYEEHSQKLSDLAHEEELKGGAAEAFGKHFGELLDNLLIAAKEAKLKRLRDQKRAGS